LIKRAEEWDMDPLLLGTPAGIYDLKTGELYDGGEAYIRKSTSVAPADSPDCPLWEDLLITAMEYDAEKVGYLQREVGYGLTASTKEQNVSWQIGGGVQVRNRTIGRSLHRKFPNKPF
jgi:putative DNA primase/helicase